MRVFILLLSVVLQFSFFTHAQAAYRVSYKVIENGTSTKRFPISTVYVKENQSFSQNKKILSNKGQILRSLPYYWEEHAPLKPIRFEEVLISDEMVSPQIQALSQTLTDDINIGSGTEMRTIVGEGPIENRIHLTILGDGYTIAEKEKFFSDAVRITKELFEGPTFKDYLPLFQVHAVYVPSKESGLGDGSPKNTAFRLFRDPPGSKRAIMPGDEAALEKAILLAPKTDYPIVIANDEFYGGLGGRYAISTRSERSGMIVLRHELGHNFGEVGEEYDSGYVYSGANSSRTSKVNWPQWVEGNLEVHEAKYLSGQYVWKNLNGGGYKAQFKANVSPTDWIFGTISSVGWDTENDVDLFLNGIKLRFPGMFHEDRNFHTIEPTQGFTSGNYTFEARENIHDGNNVLAFANIYSAPQNYNFTPNVIGAFSTFDAYGNKFYRPTHESCLMRDMEVKHFCSVDYENMWFKFLNRVSLIDSTAKEATANGKKVYRVFTPAIEGLKISWRTKSGKAITSEGTENFIEIEDPKEPVIVEVELRTLQIRKKAIKFSAEI